MTPDLWTTKASGEIAERLAEENAGHELFLQNLVRGGYTAFGNYLDGTLRFAVARRWNSWYPSYFDVVGGCYAIIPGDARNAALDQGAPGVVVIDPGFGFIETLRREFQIEPQDISAVVVTHFHPDHMAGLLELATIKQTSRSRLQIMVNSTLYQIFHSLHTEYTSVHELKEGQIRRVLGYTATDGTQVSVRVRAEGVHHDEIGNRHRALGLIVEFLLEPGTGDLESTYVYSIAVVGDTDGSAEYVPRYVRDFKSVDGLVLHLGTFKRTSSGEGGKHLYVDGLAHLLREMGVAVRGEALAHDLPADCRRLVLLSEFGLELAQHEQLYEQLWPTMRSLAWRALFIYAKLRGSGSGGLAEKVAESFFARGTLETIAQVADRPARTRAARRSSEEWLAALGITVRDVEDSSDQQLPALVAAVGRLKAEARSAKFADGATLESYVVQIEKTAPALLGRVRELWRSLVSEAGTQFGYLDVGAIRDGAERLWEEAVHATENLDTWATYREVEEYVAGYARGHGLAKEWRDVSNPDVPMTRRVESLVGVHALREVLREEQCREPAGRPAASSNLLQVGQLFQELCTDWAHLLVADVGLSLGICPIVPAPRSGYTRKRGTWLRTTAGEWIDPRAAEAVHDLRAGSITYRGVAE
jgi:ribonuclease BN (tRNA processing enzyme)